MFFVGFWAMFVLMLMILAILLGVGAFAEADEPLEYSQEGRFGLRLLGAVLLVCACGLGSWALMLFIRMVQLAQ